jgi:exopolysaccharide biosynthesis polyprenyl glycosylphosphotransferase
MVTDVLAMICTIALSHLIRFGVSVDISSTPRFMQDALPPEYLPFSILGGLIWLGLLKADHVYDHQVVGAGPEEYRRLVRCTAYFFGGLAVLSYLLKLDFSRAYFLLALPIGLLLLLLSHGLWRRWLSAQRVAGRYRAQALLVGASGPVAAIAVEICGQPDSAYHILGACTPGGSSDEKLRALGVPLLGDTSEVHSAAARVGADTVILASSSDLTPHKVKELSWMLSAEHRQLAVAPSLVDFASPRIHAQPVGGLPLLTIAPPTLDRRALLFKRTFDILLSACALILLSPVLLLTALLIKLDDHGPVLFRQQRVGQHRVPFTIYKFRSMRLNADQELQKLLKQQHTEGTPLFKIDEDPRITRIGKFLRKYSIDELPQLWNVLRGDMSLIGPRPPLPTEVLQYDARAHRRLNARPGITGLWQVSGRSELTWEQSIRLDLYYVENWSLIQDFMILVKTVRELVRPHGAY